MDQIKSVIVVGASAGGFQAVAELLSHVPSNLETAIFVVLHVARNSVGSVLVHHIQKKTSFHCKLAEDAEPIQKNYVYVAPPDFHLIIKRDLVRVVKGPHENRWRPSIDVLFRSAAAAWDSHCIGIILTGLLDDGTSGMSAIKRSGGKCIVQEPHDAEFPDMPNNVINNVEVDYRVPIADMGYVLQDIFAEPKHGFEEIPDDVKIEAEITERRVSRMEDLEKIAVRSNYSCPDCGGGMWEIKNDVLTRFRCFTGHVYTGALLLEKQSEDLEESLWVSIRMLEERRNLLVMLAKREEEGSNDTSENDKLKKADELTTHIDRLKGLLTGINKTSALTGGYE